MVKHEYNRKKLQMITEVMLKIKDLLFFEIKLADTGTFLPQQKDKTANRIPKAAKYNKLFLFPQLSIFELKSICKGIFRGIPFQYIYSSKKFTTVAGFYFRCRSIAGNRFTSILDVARFAD